MCRCAAGILSESGPGAHEGWPEIPRGIRNGYDAVNTLTAAEKQAVCYVFCSIRMICAAYFESRDAFREPAKTNWRMLACMIENRERVRSLA